MSNLLSTLLSTAGALDAYTQVLNVTQTNVANANTPGYAKQTQTLQALPFDPSMGSTGGVRAGEVQSSRDRFAEQAVRQQTTLLGQAQQNVNSFTSLQALFDISGGSGIPAALNNLFQSFSAWGQSPNSTVARQTVIQNATAVADAFQQTATGLARMAQDTTQQLQEAVTQINRMAGLVAGYNKQILNGDRSDAGLDAQINSTLEELSQYVNFTATPQSDGSMTVLINGQTPLVIGDQTYDILQQAVPPDPATAAYPGAPPHQSIVAYDGADLTSGITSGRLASLLNLTNSVLPNYLGDASHPGDLNDMAKQFADCVNNLLTSGNVSDGPPPVSGVPLFTYDTNNDTNVAMTLSVDPSVTPDQLAAITPGPPEVSNGVPLALSQLSNPHDTTFEINGASYSEFYGSMATRVGNLLNDATNELQVQQSAVAQAQNVRQQLSGVSLDEEAAILLQFQQGYEANSKLITVLEQLSQDTINMMTT